MTPEQIDAKIAALEAQLENLKAQANITLGALLAFREMRDAPAAPETVQVPASATNPERQEDR